MKTTTTTTTATLRSPEHLAALARERAIEWYGEEPLNWVLGSSRENIEFHRLALMEDQCEESIMIVGILEERLRALATAAAPAPAPPPSLVCVRYDGHGKTSYCWETPAKASLRIDNSAEFGISCRYATAAEIAANPQPPATKFLVCEEEFSSLEGAIEYSIDLPSAINAITGVDSPLTPLQEEFVRYARLGAQCAE